MKTDPEWRRNSNASGRRTGSQAQLGRPRSEPREFVLPSMKGSAACANLLGPVAQIPNLLYRRASSLRAVINRRCSAVLTLCRLEIGDTADWKSALLRMQLWRVKFIRGSQVHRYSSGLCTEEARIPKSERHTIEQTFGFRISDFFRISPFGLRVSQTRFSAKSIRIFSLTVSAKRWRIGPNKSRGRGSGRVCDCAASCKPRHMARRLSA